MVPGLLGTCRLAVELCRVVHGIEITELSRFDNAIWFSSSEKTMETVPTSNVEEEFYLP